MGLILLKKDENLEKIIGVCKSASGVCGKKLREAHAAAGLLIGREIVAASENSSFAVIVMMRSGLSFGLGIADGLEADNKVKVFFCTDGRTVPPDFDAGEFDKIVIADGVIRTGGGMLALARELGAPAKIIYAANVIDESGIPNFDGKTVYAVRSSKHSFVGSEQKNISGGKGPDTGDRLFNSQF